MERGRYCSAIKVIERDTDATARRASITDMKRSGAAWFHLCELPGISTETETRVVVARDWRRGTQ